MYIYIYIYVHTHHTYHVSLTYVFQIRPSGIMPTHEFKDVAKAALVWGRVPLLKWTTENKGYPYSNLSTGGLNLRLLSRLKPGAP